MATTHFTVSTYHITLYRDATGGGASSSFDALVALLGEGNTVYVHFLNSDTITGNSFWFPATKFGRIFMRRTLLPVVIDILRNEKPVFCQMSDTVSGLRQISTTLEPVGEGE